MVFLNAVAGPSRVTLAHAARAPAAARSASTSTFQRPYEKWLETRAQDFRRPQRGRKAKWLGGDVPYASNPTFRPPPPISDDLQTIIADELRGGAKTVGQIAQLYNVSKARIEAIRKLKAVEDEFRRQNLPLHTAFQEGMEVLLDVKSPLDQRTRAFSVQRQRAEELARSQHPATAAEVEEEERGALGAFGDPRTQAQTQGLEKDAWAFVSEAEHVAGSSAAEKALARAAAHPPRPAPPAHPSTYNKPGKSVYRFVDTSAKPAAKPAEAKKQPIKK